MGEEEEEQMSGVQEEGWPDWVYLPLWRTVLLHS